MTACATATVSWLIPIPVRREPGHDGESGPGVGFYVCCYMAGVIIGYAVG